MSTAVIVSASPEFGVIMVDYYCRPGRAGMTGLQRTVERLGVPVVDGVAAAVKVAESLVGKGLRTSRVGS